MQSGWYGHWISPSYFLLFNHLFPWKEKGKRTWLAKVNQQLTILHLINAVFYICPKDLIKETVTLGCLFIVVANPAQRILDGLPETPVRRLIPSPGSARITNRRKSQSRSLGLSSPCFSRGFPIFKMVRVNEMFFCSNFLGSHRHRLNNTGVPFIQWRKWKWPQNTNTFQW